MMPQKQTVETEVLLALMLEQQRMRGELERVKARQDDTDKRLLLIEDKADHAVTVSTLNNRWLSENFPADSTEN